jgi:hypothetical protein
MQIDPTALRRYCEKHHIRRLSLFGSQLKGNAGPHSDIDFLVEFDPEHIPGLLGIASMESELSDLLDGKQVDLRTAGDLSPYFREEVCRNAEVQYAR